MQSSSQPLSNALEKADASASSLQRSDADSAEKLVDIERSQAALSGWRFWTTMAGLYLGLFLVTLEMTVISTALVSITNDLNNFEHVNWITDAYFLTWAGFLVLWSQFSHTMGRKISLLTAIGLFLLFSAGCAAAQTASQLIILRAFQGIAAAGVFSLPIVVISEAVAPSELPKYTAFMALVTVVSFATGPLIGGAIATHTTWRWIFIMNVPGCAIAFCLDFLGLPSGFPHHQKNLEDRPMRSLASLGQLDVVGGTLFLSATILFVTALQEAGTSEPWNSSVIICLIVFAAVSAIIFVVWERHVSLNITNIMPVMTWRFCQRRTMSMFASSALIGMPFVAVLTQIPLQFQIVNGFSALQAGIHVLPYVLLMPLGTVLASMLSGKVKPIYTQLFGAALQLVAVICFATVPFSDPHNRVRSSQFAFQILFGFGNGFSYTSNFNGMPYAVDGQPTLIAPAMGANTQFRYLGAALGLGAVTAAFNGYVQSHLRGVLTPGEVKDILASSATISSLSSQAQEQVLSVFKNGFILQWEILGGVVGAQILAMLITY